MFTGIIECLGTVKGVESEGSNKRFIISAPFVSSLKVDQSVSHNGVCLTVEEILEEGTLYRITAIQETLRVSDVGLWDVGTRVNLERCMPASGRFDGHIVQGHVDTVGVVLSVKPCDGSYEITISYDSESGLVVSKGSISVQGVSLTVAGVGEGWFKVAIIPYTWEHTNFKGLLEGDSVNIEFDVIGKYIQAMMARQA